MKHLFKIKLLFITLFFLISCKKHDTITRKTLINKDSTDNNLNINKPSSARVIEKDTEGEYENENDEYISNSLFAKWKGGYILKQENLIDGWGRESISFSELYLIKPDSCIFKSWLADEDGKKYKQDDNYLEILGGIYSTEKKDSIEFYTKRVVSGGNNSLSPLLTLTTHNNSFFIYSMITSPPNNGVVKMAVKKL